LQTVLSAQIGAASRRGSMHRGSPSVQVAPWLAGYVTLVCGVAAAMLIVCLRQLPPSEVLPLGVLILLGTLSELLNVRVGVGMRYSQFILFCLVSALMLILPTPVVADAVRLGQVLRNLLANAARYAPDGTEVTIRVEARGPLAIVAVEDRGPGVRPEDRARVFEKFYRGRDAREREDGGLGLGLAIASDIVAAHGGRLWVEDAAGPGSGARFVFTLPAACAPATTGRPEESQ
jgi:signal transduction histidine kinase